MEQDQESFASGSILPFTVQSKSFSSHFAGTAGAAAGGQSPLALPGGDFQGGRQPEEGARPRPAASPHWQRPADTPVAGGSRPLTRLMFYATK